MAGIVVGVDGSDESREAFRWALEEARLRKTTLRAVYAWQDPYAVAPGYGFPEDFDFTALRTGAEERLSATVAEVAGESDVTIEEVIAEGPAASILVEAAEGADLLVVGSRGHGGFTGLLLGSVSQQCAHHAPCPVVIVRSRHTA
ncbi:MAG TPA: universal stress protein [Gaiellaceae bacterium]|nr:universal stress protein [Gaiellaceae bacterium]